MSLAIGAPAAQHDEILADLAGILPDLRGMFDRWFWLCYRTQATGPHLRVRFHGAPAVLGGELLPAVSQWGARLVADALASGFSVEPYDQEIERYGGPLAIEAAEEVFAADSDLVLATLTATHEPEQRLVVAALTAATVARTLADCDHAALGRPRLNRAAHRRLAELRRLVNDAARGGTAALPAGAAGGLADGLPGTALLHARLAVVHADFATAAANHWTHAARQTLRGVDHLVCFTLVRAWPRR
ncbi:thiopeptide-type bacteriocin biosynthesis protein [Frankia sp. CiP1_Cm_nod1]|uniref:thiopeptide-type bacteriocin biosynthesis protein n=1 Tax=Frankia sp. CiP1_Cm_nod1 TaxID=2897160 RepID=UPI004043F249